MTRFSTLKLLDKTLADIASKQATAKRLLETLSVGCQHERQAVFVWEHDDGYGMQTEHKGYCCKLCGARDYWANQHWARPEDCC